MTDSLAEPDHANRAPPESHAVAARFAALSHPARIEILKHLSASNSCCCREVVDHLDLAQSTVSQHLKILVEAGLVRFQPDRQRSRYEVDRAALADVSASLTALINSCCSGR
ncbi:winged helix-turn-helix transcriptional regulator [Mesorhizobium sp. WSM4303]|uniref:ArsR/SmtB family transcription factor n=1 Tax=unclassified Mesorhizobium TaxID=325217 RepID=UPI00115DFD34|nr:MULTISPECIES: metalloregulator ArsR/SmtB family transcription factor [unclassified Mesorhizobium]TRC95447.1 winged helix-turn-helix transcriptional regulator [Mesorhizobium sp. WSM4306]TRD08967.1 winged helix-turn-helix transcriptional regulator [Mesorhizobium sp. WSM4303]